jgi:hypothetical protein
MVQRCILKIALAPNNALIAKEFDQLGKGSSYELLAFTAHSLKNVSHPSSRLRMECSLLVNTYKHDRNAPTGTIFNERRI